jgi:hypothetical protein
MSKLDAKYLHSNRPSTAAQLLSVSPPSPHPPCCSAQSSTILLLQLTGSQVAAPLLCLLEKLVYKSGLPVVAVRMI